MAPAGILAVITTWYPQRNGTEVLTIYGAGHTPPDGCGMVPVSGVPLPLLSKSEVIPLAESIENVVLVGNVQALTPTFPGAQPVPFSGVLSIEISMLSPPLPVFQITSVQLMVCPGAADATVLGSPTVSPVLVGEALAETPAVCSTVYVTVFVLPVVIGQLAPALAIAMTVVDTPFTQYVLPPN